MIEKLTLVETLYIRFTQTYFNRKVCHRMEANIKNPITVDSTISLKGIVKAIFDNTVHIQIGGKIITMPVADFNLLKGETNSQSN